MKLSLATPTPEVNVKLPVSLLAGTFEERLIKAKAMGYHGVELMVARPANLDPKQIRSSITLNSLEISAISSGAVYMMDRLTLLASDCNIAKQANQRLEELIDFAAEVGAPLVTVGGFRGRLAWSEEENPREILIAILKSAAERAFNLGVRLALEPLNRYETDIIPNAAEGLELVQRIGHPAIGLLLDTFHVNIEEASITDCFRDAYQAGRLFHVHIGDSNRLPPGKGHINFAAIIDTLYMLGYSEYLSAELIPSPDPDTAAITTAEFIQRLLR